MSEFILQSIALFGVVVVGLVFLMEARKWRSIGAVIGRGQRRLRVWLIVLIESLFVMMFVGPWVTGKEHPIMDLIYWLLAVLLALTVMILAMIVVIATNRSYMAINRQVFGDRREDERDEL